MKRFLETLMAVKSTAALVLSGEIVLLALARMLLGYDAVPIAYLWQALALCLIVASAHFVFFSTALLPKMRPAHRLLLFGAVMLLVLAAFAYAFTWFPLGNPWAWLLFLVVALVALGLVWGAFHIYSRITGQKYSQHLTAYQSKHIR